ncbi:MAG: DUF1624 domain-containing protein [Pirellulales bacterium]|nr:DUF1624 domain-containing protein [Pirellulales bacterium]
MNTPSIAPAFVQPLPSSRLLALDAFRGLTILAMILANNPAKWNKAYIYAPLQHAEWHGWTPTDLIFPFFLFIVGTSLAYSMRKYRNPFRAHLGEGAESCVPASLYWRIARRTLLLIFLGWMPSLLIKTVHAAQGGSFDLSDLRIVGVLVRIALVYCATSLVVLHVPLRGQAMLAVVILLGYWAALTFLPNPHDRTANLACATNLVGAIDHAIIGPNHMYKDGNGTDPEGFLSTLPAIVTALIGYWVGLFIQRRGVNTRTIAQLAACGIVLALVGEAWHYVPLVNFPINKKIWTSSFVLLTGGLGMVALCGCLLVFDQWGWRRLARPFEIVGVNAILVFVASGLLSTALDRWWTICDSSAKDWLFEHLFTSWIHDPKLASLGFALLTATFWWVVCWAMARRGWALRV